MADSSQQDRVRVVVDLDSDDCGALDKIVKIEKLNRSDVLRRLIRQEAHVLESLERNNRRTRRTRLAANG